MEVELCEASGRCGNAHKPSACTTVLKFTPVDERVTSLCPRFVEGNSNCCLCLCTKQQFRVLGLLGDPERSSKEDSIVLLGELNVYLGNNRDTWRGMIGRDWPP